MNIDLWQEPFSCRGSYMAISHIGRETAFEELYLKCCHGQVAPMEIARIQMETSEGNNIPFEEIATPALLCLKNGDREICFSFEDSDTLRIRTKGCRLRLTIKNNGYGYDSALLMAPGIWQVNSCTHHTNYVLMAAKGSLHGEAPWSSVGSKYINFLTIEAGNGEWEGILKEYPVNPQIPELSKKSWMQCVRDRELSFSQWMETMPQVPKAYQDAKEKACYVMWTSYVAAQGNYDREAMLMSKNWMTNVWSWDHCFNAMALSIGKEEEAWNQFRIIYDKQNPYGQLPDYVSDTSMLWSFAKTPIHGWTLKWMMDRKLINKERLAEIYEPMVKQVEWWFTYRDYDHDGMPQCNHGNDSVSDNCTVFDQGCPLESPVLSAFLILQMDTLSELAAILDKNEEEKKWKERSDQHFENFKEHFWVDGEIVARLSGSHKIVTADSNYMYLPIVLGDRLPVEMKEWLVRGLSEQGSILTPSGLATESPDSPFYESNSYCRGPVWAPTMLILVDGLKSVGEEMLAKKVAGRFCDTVKNSHMAECFDALTGMPYRDPAYTWTASVFLILASEYIGA